ncbi:MAG: tetratricopeptide repeat protein, partial [Pseudomonadota bacterium]
AGRFDDAIAAYQDALSNRLDERLRFLAHEGQGYAHEGKGDTDKALAAFAQISGDATAFGGFYQDAALYHKARLTEAKGDKSGAVAIYKQILDKVPETAMKDQITDRLALLEAK